MQNDTPTTPSGEQELHAAVAAAAAAAEGKVEELGDDFYEELAEIQRLGAKESHFQDCAELLATEANEQGGVWEPVPFLAGAEVLITHQMNSMERREKLEEVFREKNNLGLDVPLSRKTREAIWREAYYGTVARDWRGFKMNGELLVFNAENFRRLMTSRQFRMFISQRSAASETFRKSREGQLRGNS